MPKSFAMPQSADLPGAVTELCKGLLEKGVLEAILVPQHLPKGDMVQHTLVRDPAALQAVDPIAPVLPVHGGIMAARLTRDDPGGMVGALLRPCEIRGFVELVKLHQGDRERLLLLGIDCLGTFEPSQYRAWTKADPTRSVSFLGAMLSKGDPPDGSPLLRTSCRACEYPTPEAADIQILLIGADASKGCLVAATPRGEEVARALGLATQEPPAQRGPAVESLVKRRIQFRDGLFQEVEAHLLPLGKLMEELAACINCYNCRDACPVCYCKSCVMDSGTMEHASWRYVRWARRKGVIKMPTETLFYHMTRMAHMSTSCVGCGLCSSACPMGIRVAEIFRTVARRTQGALNYVPGRSLEDPLPLATFREEELSPR
ncbi:MAG: 4Fe-4S dicluster domain-containing protein [Thermodesulfobacteriota bacterium]